MFHKKELKKDIKKIGKDKYKFDYEKELLVYKYVCCKRIKKRELEKLTNNQKFDCYLYWKQSICERYKDYNYEELLNFSRYLNQRIRNEVPNKEYSRIYIPVILSLGITSIYNVIVNTKFDLFDCSTCIKIGIAIIYVLLITVSLFFVVWFTYNPLYENNDEENLLIDYKEIIDEILCVRENAIQIKR